jgi:hypothetical protein
MSKRGRPSNKSLALESKEAKAERVARNRKAVISHHRRDCKHLRQVIAQARDADTLSSADAQRVASATKTLHELERQAYDLTGATGTVQAVIMLPVAAPTMEAWNQLAGGTFPRSQAKELADPRRIEPDIVGEPPPREPEDVQDGAGDQGQGMDREATG